MFLILMCKKNVMFLAALAKMCKIKKAVKLNKILIVFSYCCRYAFLHIILTREFNSNTGCDVCFLHLIKLLKSVVFFY